MATDRVRTRVRWAASGLVLTSSVAVAALIASSPYPDAAPPAATTDVKTRALERQLRAARVQHDQQWADYRKQRAARQEHLRAVAAENAATVPSVTPQVSYTPAPPVTTSSSS